MKVFIGLCNVYSTEEGLTWHGAIPTSEIWIKLGGDKGHGSFKLNMQVINTSHPNSIKNTTVLAVYKASDTPTNLRTALNQYQTHVEEMQGMSWRY